MWLPDVATCVTQPVLCLPVHGGVVFSIINQYHDTVIVLLYSSAFTMANNHPTKDSANPLAPKHERKAIVFEKILEVLACYVRSESTATIKHSIQLSFITLHTICYNADKIRHLIFFTRKTQLFGRFLHQLF